MYTPVEKLELRRLRRQARERDQKLADLERRADGLVALMREAGIMPIEPPRLELVGEE